MSNFITSTIVSIAKLKGVKLESSFGGELIQEGLSIGIGIEVRALGTTAGLFACNIIAVLVVNIDTIKFLIADDVYETCAELFFSSKTIIPTVIVITCDRIL